MARKDHIPIRVKINVWAAQCHPSDKRVCQCATCNTLVRIPEGVRKKTSCPSMKNMMHAVQGVGEFGHIVSEYNGGKAREDNLLIQCKTCNTRLGSRNIEKHMLNPDSAMLDRYTDEHEGMDLESHDGCMGITRGRKCKNRCRDGELYCHIHLV
jgi:hypothetical protein